MLSRPRQHRGELPALSSDSGKFGKCCSWCRQDEGEISLSLSKIESQLSLPLGHPDSRHSKMLFYKLRIYVFYFIYFTILYHHRGFDYTAWMRTSTLTANGDEGGSYLVPYEGHCLRICINRQYNKKNVSIDVSRPRIEPVISRIRDSSSSIALSPMYEFLLRQPEQFRVRSTRSGTMNCTNDF
jgi:hypothetical protein